MAGVSTKKKNTITCLRGNTSVDGAVASITYKYKWWWFQVNPRLKFPAFRVDHKKNIYINGKKVGYGSYHNGCVPLPRYKLPGKSLSVKWRNFLRLRLGLRCNPLERGYYLVHLWKYDYIVTKSVTAHGNTCCIIYYRANGLQMGTFIFDVDFGKVYPDYATEGWTMSMFAVIGYVADSVIYSLAAGQLNKTIEISM